MYMNSNFELWLQVKHDLSKEVARQYRRKITNVLSEINQANTKTPTEYLDTMLTYLQSHFPDIQKHMKYMIQVDNAEEGVNDQKHASKGNQSFSVFNSTVRAIHHYGQFLFDYKDTKLTRLSNVGTGIQRSMSTRRRIAQLLDPLPLLVLRRRIDTALHKMQPVLDKSILFFIDHLNSQTIHNKKDNFNYEMRYFSQYVLVPFLHIGLRCFEFPFSNSGFEKCIMPPDLESYDWSLHHLSRIDQITSPEDICRFYHIKTIKVTNYKHLTRLILHKKQYYVVTVARQQNPEINRKKDSTSALTYKLIATPIGEVYSVYLFFYLHLCRELSPGFRNNKYAFVNQAQSSGKVEVKNTLHLWYTFGIDYTQYFDGPYPHPDKRNLTELFRYIFLASKLSHTYTYNRSMYIQTLRGYAKLLNMPLFEDAQVLRDIEQSQKGNEIVLNAKRMYEPIPERVEGVRAAPDTAVNQGIRPDVKTYLQDLMMQYSNQYLCE